MRGPQRGLALGLLLALTGCSTMARRPDRIPPPPTRPPATTAAAQEPVDLFQADPPDAVIARYFPNLAGKARFAPAARKVDSDEPPRTTPSGPDLTADGPRHPHSKLKGDALRGVPLLPVTLNVRAFPDDSPDPGAIARRDRSQVEARLRPRPQARDEGASPVRVAAAPSRSRDEHARPVRVEADLAAERAPARPEARTDDPGPARGRPIAATGQGRILDIPEDVLAEAAREAASSHPTPAARAEDADTGPPPGEAGPPPLEVSSSSGPSARALDPAAAPDRRPAARAPIRVARRSSSYRPEDLPPVQFPSSYYNEPDPGRAEPPPTLAVAGHEAPAGRLRPRRGRDETRASDRDGRESLAGRFIQRLRGRVTGPAAPQPQPVRGDQDQEVRRAGATRKRPDYWFSDPEVRRAGATERRPDYGFNL